MISLEFEYPNKKKYTITAKLDGRKLLWEKEFDYGNGVLYLHEIIEEINENNSYIYQVSGVCHDTIKFIYEYIDYLIYLNNLNIKRLFIYGTNYNLFKINVKTCKIGKIYNKITYRTYIDNLSNFGKIYMNMWRI